MPKPPTCLCGDCAKCRKRAYDKIYRATRRRRTDRDCAAESRQRLARGRAFIDAQKAEGCAVCGFAVPVALDFHHLDPAEKTTEVTRLAMCSEERILAEIAKCILLCSNHHRMFHAGLLKVASLG